MVLSASIVEVTEPVGRLSVVETVKLGTVNAPAELIVASGVPPEFCHSCKLTDWLENPLIVKPIVSPDNVVTIPLVEPIVTAEFWIILPVVPLKRAIAVEVAEAGPVTWLVTRPSA